jgi:hypothetical protein
VVRFRGSYLELMLALERYGSGLDREHVLVHLPGINTDTVKDTPLFELYRTGISFQKDLATLVREAAVGTARPAEVEAFVNAPGLTLSAADAWLAGLSAGPRDGLTLLLESLGLDAVVLGLLSDDTRLRAHLPSGGGAILNYLERGIGLGAAWRGYRLGGREPTSERTTRCSSTEPP